MPFNNRELFFLWRYEPLTFLHSVCGTTITSRRRTFASFNGITFEVHGVIHKS
jgi:hypothetical protein